MSIMTTYCIQFPRHGCSPHPPSGVDNQKWTPHTLSRRQTLSGLTCCWFCVCMRQQSEFHIVCHFLNHVDDYCNTIIHVGMLHNAVYVCRLLKNVPPCNYFRCLHGKTVPHQLCIFNEKIVFLCTGIVVSKPRTLHS